MEVQTINSLKILNAKGSVPWPEKCTRRKRNGENENFIKSYTILKMRYSVFRSSSVLARVPVNRMSCWVSSIGPESRGFLHEMISLLSFCCAWLTTEFLRITLMRFTALRGVSGVSCCQNKQRVLINMAVSVLCLSFGEIFSASQILL